MFIEYQIADGRKISYDTYGSAITLSDIDAIAMIYAQTMHNQLPTHCFMHISVYSEFVRQMGAHTFMTSVPNYGQVVTYVMTGCGPLIVRPMPWAYDKFRLLIGTEHDYDRYNIDQVFEEIVLKDCEVAD